MEGRLEAELLKPWRHLDLRLTRFRISATSDLRYLVMGSHHAGARVRTRMCTHKHAARIEQSDLMSAFGGKADMDFTV